MPSSDGGARPQDSPTPPTDGAKVRPFGVLALEMGAVEEAALREALERQSALRRRGVRRQIGELLTESGAMRPSDLIRVLAAQGREIRRCPGCGFQVAVPVTMPAGKPRCGACGVPCEPVRALVEVRDAATVLHPEGGDVVASYARTSRLLGEETANATATYIEYARPSVNAQR